MNRWTEDVDLLGKIICSHGDLNVASAVMAAGTTPALAPSRGSYGELPVELSGPLHHLAHYAGIIHATQAPLYGLLITLES
jgi:hypothetical protein